MSILLSAIFESSTVDVCSVLVLFSTNTTQREGSEVAYYRKDVVRKFVLSTGRVPEMKE